MDIIKTLFSQRSDQKERNNVTNLIKINGKPDKNNLFENYIYNASKMCYVIKENGAYYAIEYKEKYIVRIYKNNDNKGSFKIRFLPNDFNLSKKNISSNKKISNNINDCNKLNIAIDMLREKLK